ncbi:MAG: exonuclease domain-containing protein [Candidatus Obscuribacterales bacterium]|uniref:Exonuclease domain-containing protein n=1 Tax=Candidatus Obscuribacter phosphatis TaxID=1906157 RepID=A0A8J7TMS7_9BACT|nr:exonuclease domain-containing protein [Candidatus Obscuribacter phosphatis]MBX9941874.1 exonuclease domain-containing protein [Candidatus Obscuribacterales bacterium]
MKTHIANAIDLELSCYPGGIFPPDERQEIIEIGLSVIDLTSMKVLKTHSLPVIPTMSSISPFCTELTGWTEAALKRQGMPFEEAIRRLTERYGSQNRLLITDSAGDRKFVDWQCSMFGMASPFGDSELNVSVLYSIQAQDFRNRKLEDKLRRFGLEFEGTPHRASDDSLNIARLACTLLKRGV